MTKTFKLGSKHRRAWTAYIIAEIGVNHEGSLDKAKSLILDAKEGGADAVKFQTYKAASEFSPAYWDKNKEQLNHNMNCSKSLIGLILKTTKFTNIARLLILILFQPHLIWKQLIN